MGLSLYTKQHAEILRSIKKPVPITVDIAEGDEGLHIVVYEDEVMNFEEVDRYVIMDYLQRVQRALQSTGVEVELEGRSGRPN